MPVIGAILSGAPAHLAREVMRRCVLIVVTRFESCLSDSGFSAPSGMDECALTSAERKTCTGVVSSSDHLPSKTSGAPHEP